VPDTFTDSALSGEREPTALDEIVTLRSAPESITVDNWTQFASKAMDLCAYKNGVHLDFIRPWVGQIDRLRPKHVRNASAVVPF